MEDEVECLVSRRKRHTARKRKSDNKIHQLYPNLENENQAKKEKQCNEHNLLNSFGSPKKRILTNANWIQNSFSSCQKDCSIAVSMQMC